MKVFTRGCVVGALALAVAVGSACGAPTQDTVAATRMGSGVTPKVWADANATLSPKLVRSGSFAGTGRYQEGDTFTVSNRSSGDETVCVFVRSRTSVSFKPAGPSTPALWHDKPSASATEWYRGCWGGLKPGTYKMSYFAATAAGGGTESVWVDIYQTNKPIPYSV